MKPSFIIERWPHGWLICTPQDSNQSGIPITALNECLPLFPAEACMDSGVARYYRYQRRAVLAVGDKDGLGDWREAIDKELSWMSDESRWYLGCDTGMSSLTMFFKLASDRKQANEAFEEIGRKPHHPHDADDFGRCFRLVEKMKWHERIGEMADLSPEWKDIADRWQQLCELFKQGKLGLIEFPK